VPFLEMRLLVIASLQVNASDHVCRLDCLSPR
jgi:hypothetical protein